MMKRVILLILAVLMVLSVLAACGSQDGKSEDSASAAGGSILRGAESPEAAVQQMSDGVVEQDGEKFYGVMYTANFGQDMTFEEYVESFNKNEFDADHLAMLKQTTSKVTSKQEWEADRVKEAAEKLASNHNDTDKIIAMADITYVVSGGEIEPTEYNITAIECSGRWYLKP